MKNHKKYAKLPQDLDLSFQEQLDAVDTAVADDFNLSGSGLDEDDDNILDDRSGGRRRRRRGGRRNSYCLSSGSSSWSHRFRCTFSECYGCGQETTAESQGVGRFGQR